MTAMLNRRQRIRPVNAKRRAENWKRAYGSEDRVAWVKQLNCVACGRTPCENAHTANGGMGRKADASTIIPLCKPCHHDLHVQGRRVFEASWTVDLARAAERTEQRWRDMLATGHIDLGF